MDKKLYEKIVDFTFCKSCKHENKAGDEAPCDDCLDNPVNLFSIRPVHYEAAQRRANKNEKD